MWRIVYLLIILIFIREKASDKHMATYGGEKFPSKYLSVEKHDATFTDLDRFIESLNLSLNYFNSAPNETDINISLGTFFTKSVLKRTLLDYSNKINKFQRETIRKLINMCENIISHYMYENAPYSWDDFEYRASRIFELDESQIYTIGDFNRDRLQKWLLTRDININSYLEQMDEATLPKEEYCKVSNNFDDFHIHIKSSDYCISCIAFNKEPIHFSQMEKCRTNTHCEKRIYRSPSVAYSLSHRFLNLYLRHSTKRCYVKSEEQDKLIMDQMCANMFRESVYLARRGFFARDLFLEHVGLCSLLGYEEFHRKNWYYKAMSWIGKEGCIAENRNFLLNYTKFKLKSDHNDFRQRRKYRELYCKAMHGECGDHPTAVLIMVLAQAIRYTAYKLK